MVCSILSRFQCQLVFFCISLLVKWRSIVMCFVWWIQRTAPLIFILWWCTDIYYLFIDKTLSIWQRTFFGDTSLIFGWHVLSVHVACMRCKGLWLLRLELWLLVPTISLLCVESQLWELELPCNAQYDMVVLNDPPTSPLALSTQTTNQKCCGDVLHWIDLQLLLCLFVIQ